VERITHNQHKMHKGKLLIAILILALFITGCGGYDVPKPNLTDETRQIHEDRIQESLEVLSTADITDAQKIEAMRSLGINYERLGEYDEALKYYKQVLEAVPTEFLALNNSAAIYEEVGELKLAAQQLNILYQNNKSNQRVISDVIRLLVKNGDFDNAQFLLNEYARDYQDDTTRPFISEQFEYIGRFSAKAQTE
jgi:tetratricopeptide (TPR) repeat protein